MPSAVSLVNAVNAMSAVSNSVLRVSSPELDRKLRELAVRNACTAPIKLRKSEGWKLPRNGWKLLRDLKAVEESDIKRKLAPQEIRFAVAEWYRLSQAFLDPAKTLDDYMIAFLGAIDQVRKATGKTLEAAKADVRNLAPDQLIDVHGWPDAPLPVRRIATLHYGLSRSPEAKEHGGLYFLDYRSAGEVAGVSPTTAQYITRALARCYFIEIVSNGKAGVTNGKAAEFRCFLSGDEDEGFVF